MDRLTFNKKNMYKLSYIITANNEATGSAREEQHGALRCVEPNVPQLKAPVEDMRNGKIIR